jgi:GNAT superfamily N-acetyltransferase
MVGPAFAGTASLREESGTVCPDLGPWLTHLYVDPPIRNRGIGTSLIRAIETEAVRHGFTALHAATARASRVFERLGWTVVDVVEYQGDRVHVLRTTLTPPPGN